MEDNNLYAVAANSSTDAWAVGYEVEQGVKRTLTEHWYGASWNWIASPNRGSLDNVLLAVAGLSLNRAVAVGYSTDAGGGRRTLIEFWDGTRWRIVPSPTFGQSSTLNAVTAVSDDDVWAVGTVSAATGSRTLTLHWNGRRWSAVQSPSPGTQDTLVAADAITTDDVWAAGSDAGTLTTLGLHWDGAAWDQAATPSPAAENYLTGVAATSTRDVWAVGYLLLGGSRPSLIPGASRDEGFQTLTEHWDGTSWSVVSSPNVGDSSNVLLGAAESGNGNVWAVGRYISITGSDQTLIEQWTGSAWSVVPSPNVGSLSNVLRGVTAVSATRAWAVGGYGGGVFSRTLIQGYCA